MAAVLLAAGFIGTIAYAVVAINSPDLDGTIHACVDEGGKGAGKIRIVNDGTTCKSSEFPLQWKDLSTFDRIVGSACSFGGGGTIALTYDAEGIVQLKCETEDPPPSECGNGVIDSSRGEVCDDGGGSSGDGCDSECKIEPNWTCSGTPSTCSADAGCGTYFADNDNDAFGGGSGVFQCGPEAGFVAQGGDCDDSDAVVNPNATETCDAANTDEDCDGQADDLDSDTAAGQATWYSDSDGDGHGDPDSPMAACDASAGRVNDNSDCDDSTETTHPGAAEICDGVDNDCDGQADDGGVCGPE